MAIGLVLGLCASTGCKTFLPRRETPDAGMMPQTFSTAGGEQQTPDRWWDTFNSPQLSALVDEALAENLSLRQAWARLDQAGATAVQAGASLYPSLDLSANAAYERRESTNVTKAPSVRSQIADAAASGMTTGVTNAVRNQLNGTTGTTATGTTGASTAFQEDKTTRVKTETQQYGLGVAASYEIDLWGRIWSQRQSAEHDVQATVGDMQTTAMTLASEVATRWLGIIEQREKLRVLREQLETNRTYLELVELRFRKSLVSALDVFQQQQAVAAVEKQIPQVEAQEQVLRHELAILLGKPPQWPFDVGDYDLEQLPPIPPAGIPADLLANRPDIRAAYARLRAADYSVAAARADRLPAIRLTGGASYSAGQIEFLFDDWVANIAASLTAPLFDGFRRKAEVERTLAVVEERLAAYRLTVLTAIGEVEDALVEERLQRDHIEALSRQLTAAQNALDEAAERYRKGLNDYLPVLTALESTQQLTRDLITARRELLVLRVDLHRALGGSWMSALEAPERLSEENVIARAED